MSGDVRSLEIDGFLSLRRARVDLGGVTLLIGANGAGKSNVVKAFELLGRIVDDELDLFVQFTRGSANALLFDGPDPARAIGVRVQGDPNGYRAVLLTDAEDRLFFLKESTTFKGRGYDRPFETELGSGHRSTQLTSSRHDVPAYTQDLLNGCRVFHFDDVSTDSPVKQFGPAADNISLARDARNLAAVLARLLREEPSVYRRIVSTLRLTAPFVRELVLEEEGGERIRLRWRQEGTDSIFPAAALSDGTLRFLCLVTLLLHPRSPRLVVLDEPELGLHPFAIVQLADLMRSAANERQIVAATQSVTLINQFGADDIRIVERTHGGTVITRPDVDSLSEWLQEYSLGELWEKNLLGGRPVQETR